MNQNSEVVVFKFVGESAVIVINCRNCLFGTKVNNTLDAC